MPCFLQQELLKLLLNVGKVLVLLEKQKAGTDLKRWQAEKWQDTKSGKACGAGGKNEYCRPTKRVSKDTPKTKYELTPSKLAAKKAEKSRVGMGRRVKNV